MFCFFSSNTVRFAVTLLMSTGVGVKVTGVTGTKGPISSFFPSPQSKMYFWHDSTFSLTLGSRASEHEAYPGGGRKRNSPCRPPNRKRTLISRKKTRSEVRLHYSFIIFALTITIGS